MKNKEINIKYIIFAIIILICIFALSYGVYYQVFVKPAKEIANNIPEKSVTKDIQLDELFDNKVNLQNYTSANFVNKIQPSKDVVYTTYSLNEIYEGKYEMQVNIPLININNESAIKIDKEILSIFYDKVKSIIDNSREETTAKTIYTVSYTAYLNENLLSLVIKANLKEGDKPQRVIIKTYTYNVSTNKEISLNEIIDLKNLNSNDIQSKITKTIEDAISSSDNLSSLGYTTYKRNIDNSMYKIENSTNYLLGPNNTLYIIYAYGNSNFTTDKDVVYIK